MKYLVPLLVLAVTGCQSKPISPPLPRAAMDPKPIAATPAAAAAARPAVDHEAELRRQTQLIEALVNENDALKAKLETMKEPPPSVLATKPEPAPVPLPKAAPIRDNIVPAAAARATTTPADEHVLSPDAEGIIDVPAAIAGATKGEPVNPFALRVPSPEGAREISLRVDGVIEGGTAGAVINDEVVQAGEVIDALTVERIEPDGVILRDGSERLRIPVAEKPTRVRLAL